MELEKAQEIIQVLADGYDPVTGEVFPPDSPYNNPEIIRALFTILQELKARPHKPKKDKPKNAGLPWTEALKEEVVQLYKEGQSFKELAAHFERSVGTIKSELSHQGVIE